MNVLLVTIDSLRTDRVVEDNDLTPTIDALAAEGIDCPEAISHGHGTPIAFPSILSGTYPALHGGVSYFSEQRPALASRLQRAGYDTAAFTSNPHLFERYGYENGFDDFNAYGESGDDSGHSWIDRIRLFAASHVDEDSTLYNLLRRVYYILLTATKERPYTPADQINDRFFDWLDGRDSDDPFFSWVHYMDVHYPFYQDEEIFEKIGVDPIPVSRQREVNRLMNEEPEAMTEEDIADLATLYDAETRFTDDELRRLLDELRARDEYEDTLVIVTSDHGEALGEHDAFGHYGALYEELVRVPLVFRIPGEESATVSEQVGLADIAPTVLDYLGEPVEVDDDEPFSGASIRPLAEGTFEGGSDDWSGNCHVIAQGDPIGLRTPHWKYTWWEHDGPEPRRVELFDLDADPEETTDVSDEHPEVVAEFDEYLAEHVRHAEATDHDPDAPAEEADDDVQEQLEALGYT
jgi:arylsulfatase A-like enzyme